MLNNEITLYAVQNHEGKYFKNRGMGGGLRWVTGLQNARIYFKPGPARVQITIWSNLYLGVPAPKLVQIKGKAELSRAYNIPISEYFDMFTVKEWKQAVADSCFTTYDGTGYWVRNGQRSIDEVFNTPSEDATHVAWANK